MWGGSLPHLENLPVHSTGQPTTAAKEKVTMANLLIIDLIFAGQNL